MNDSERTQRNIQFIIDNKGADGFDAYVQSPWRWGVSRVVIPVFFFIIGLGIEKLGVSMITLTKQASKVAVIPSTFISSCQIAYRVLFLLFLCMEVANIIVWFRNRGISQMLELIVMGFGTFCLVPAMMLFSIAFMTPILASVWIVVNIVLVFLIFYLRYTAVLRNRWDDSRRKLTQYLGIIASVGVPAEIIIMLLNGGKFYAILIILVFPFAVLAMTLYITNLIATYCAIFKDVLPNQEVYRIGLGINKSSWYRK